MTHKTASKAPQNRMLVCPICSRAAKQSKWDISKDENGTIHYKCTQCNWDFINPHILH